MNRWEKSGLLKGLNEEESIECSQLLEATANYLLNNECSDFVKQTLIPAVRRTYDGIKWRAGAIPDTLIEITNIVNKVPCQIELKQLGLLLDTENALFTELFYMHIDREVEIVSRAVEKYLENNKK